MSFKQPVSVLVVIHTPDNDILLLERAANPGYWQSVTGSRENEEALADTALREVREETGIDVAALGLALRDWRQVNTYEIFPEWRHRYAPGVTRNTEHVFSLEVPHDTPVRIAPGEHTRFCWLPQADAASRVFSWSNRDAILQLPLPGGETACEGATTDRPRRAAATPHPNAELVARLYAALGQRDGAAMATCYADDARFSDPVFPDLDAAGVRGMWRMLCARTTDLHVDVVYIVADERSGRARWTATYTFAGTGRRVRNVIDAEFVFRDGRIARQHDRFDLWRWAGMALGLKGWLLGWSPLVRDPIRHQADRALASFLARGKEPTAPK